jgi:hypothetical protein
MPLCIGSAEVVSCVADATTRLGWASVAGAVFKTGFGVSLFSASFPHACSRIREDVSVPLRKEARMPNKKSLHNKNRCKSLLKR